MKINVKNNELKKKINKNNECNFLFGKKEQESQEYRYNFNSL